MKFRMLWALAIAALAVAVATACVPDPAPTTSPAPTFSTEEEAFAAAEQTYRAYVDALNKVDLGDPATFEGVYSLTSGEANAADRKSFSQMHADEWTVSGTTRAALVEPLSVASSIELAVCLDVSAVTLTDPSGNSVVDPQRSNVQSQLVTLEPSSDSPTGLLINSFAAREGEPTCDG